MKIYTLEPQDFLFFRDGRPTETSGGNGARWPEPSIIFDALHAALWRAFPGDHPQPWEHRHDFGRSSHRPCGGDTQRFGSLATTGLFPVWTDGRWLFPAPADVVISNDRRNWLLSPRPIQGTTNLPACFLQYTVASRAKPTKESVSRWWSAAAWQDYLAGKQPARAEQFTSDDLFAGEWTTGIGIDPKTQTQDGQRLYSAEYLRLRPNVRCGFSASLRMKQN
ncbi:MAG: type III-B CRISPR module-associated Cmr3 family protein [Limisphaerales bacterium]